MLTPEQVELIQRDVDGANSPEESAFVRALVAQDADAHALDADLRRVAALLGRVQERPPPPWLRQKLVRQAQEKKHKSVSLLRLVTQRLEEAMSTKRTLIVGTTAVAAIAIIGAVVVGYPPTGDEAGTIGGVQQASRYRGRQMSEKDVTIANPEIQTLFQNEAVLTLVKSEAFRTAMNSEAFRSLQNNEAFRELLSSDAFRDLMNNEAYHDLLNNESFRELMNNDASREQMQNEAWRELASNEAFRTLQNNEAFKKLQNNEAFHDVMSNEAFRDAMSNDAFRDLMSSDAFRALQNSDAFRGLSRSAQLSEAFLNEASRQGR